MELDPTSRLAKLAGKARGKQRDWSKRCTAPAATLLSQPTSIGRRRGRLPSSFSNVRREGLPWRRRSAQMVRLTPALTAQPLAVSASGLNRINSSNSLAPASDIAFNYIHFGSVSD
jgi:hypothetical protein